MGKKAGNIIEEDDNITLKSIKRWWNNLVFFIIKKGINHSLIFENPISSRIVGYWLQSSAKDVLFLLENKAF